MGTYGKQTLLDSRGVPVEHSGRMMKRNPRSGKVITSDTTPLVDERTGEYNAGSKQELWETMESLIHQMKTGELQPNRPEASFAADKDDWLQEGHLVRAAFESKNPMEPDGPFQVLGEVFTDDIYETMGRTAFADKVLAHQDVKEGGMARVRIHRKDVVAWFMVDDGTVAESVVKQGWIFPDGFDIEANIIMREAEIFEAGSQILEEKYQDGVESTLVREDRILKHLFDLAAQAPNDILLFSSFTPTVFTNLRRQVLEWGIAVPHAIVAIDIMDDLFADSDWQSWYSPIEKHELAMEGRLGKLGDVELLTDGFRYETLKVLDQGEVYFLGAQQALGMKSMMVPLKSEVINQAVIGRARRGWFLYQREALTVANSRSVSKGIRQP